MGAIFGGPVAWPLCDKFGRQATLMLGGVPSLIGWILMANAHIISNREIFIVMLLVGRFLAGLSVGWSIFCVSVS